MSARRIACIFCLWWSVSTASAQMVQVEPHILTRTALDGKVTVVEVAAHFVTAIRMPEAVNSVVVGDPALFQVEHSERDPELVFVKPLTTRPVETNLLVSTTRGREVSLLVISRGEQNSQAQRRVDFLVKYKHAGRFLIEPDYPSTLIGETEQVAQVTPTTPNSSVTRSSPQPRSLTPVSLPSADPETSPGEVRHAGLDELLERQKHAPLPLLYGEHVRGEKTPRERIHAGVSEVIDGGQQVVALFSVVNPTDHNILLMPPQIQLGGKTKSGKIIRRSHWSTADQLPVMDFRLSRRRLGPGERADGVVLFERPPYKQSNETLLLQMAESGAVDRPALAPIGFGISRLREEPQNGTGKRATRK